MDDKPLTIGSLAAFNPHKLAMKLANLPEGAVVYALDPTGPCVAMPKDPGSDPIGAIVYDDDTISIWTGHEYQPVYRLREQDGNPSLIRLGFRET